jgi:hypothetical protein
MVERPESEEPTRSSSDLEAECRKHLAFVRKNCPGMLPQGPVKPGMPVPPVPVDTRTAAAILRAAVKGAAAAATGQRPADPPPGAVVWTDGADSLLVLLDSVQVSTSDGVITVGLDVACDQALSASGEPRSHVDVDLVVGTRDRPTGLLAAAPVPRGLPVVVDRWHDALVALAWQALLDAAAALSASVGADTDGTRLVPTRLTASKDGITVGPQARHPFDRRPATSGRAAR